MFGRHLVNRCPYCERPVWQKAMAKLLGFGVIEARRVGVAFIAVGKRGGGWRAEKTLHSLAAVEAEGGPESVQQLRMLAKRVLRKMFLSGLLDGDDLRELLSISSSPVTAPTRTLDRGVYELPSGPAPSSRLYAVGAPPPPPAQRPAYVPLPPAPAAQRPAHAAPVPPAPVQPVTPSQPSSAPPTRTLHTGTFDL